MEFGILGPVEVWVNGRPANAGHARQRAVLAVLLLDLGRAVPMEALIDRVWGENPPRSVRNVVYGYVARLRALIADGQDPRVSLSRRPGGYLLQAEPDQVDLGRFRRLVADGVAASGDDEQVGAALGAAVRLWRGPTLAGLDSPWLNAMRAGLDLERSAAALNLNEIRLRRGEHYAVADELAAQAAAAPGDERLIGQLMLALYRCGRPAEAVRWYERTRRHLADELGADPGPRLAALHQQVLRADPALAAGPGTAVPHAGPVPRELPSDVPAFTGRAAELAELDRLLTRSATQAAEATHPGVAVERSPAAVISAMSGTAGVGKTALAVHWAHRVGSRFPDGQLYVNFRGYDPDRPVTAADALAAFLRTLGLPGQDIPPGQDERAARYRSLLAGKRMLVLLDNVSQAEQVRPLLPGTPGCAVLVTSRDALAGLVARDGAARLDLGLLPLDDAVSLLRELIGERADADLAATTALAGQCCRLPLALRVAAELAAKRSDIPLADLVNDLADQENRLDLLDADGDPRTAVRAVFGWSYRYLEADDARGFRLAGLHPGPDFDPYAIAALTGSNVEQVRRALEALARAHLIHPTAPGRYAMHDLLRAYAREIAATTDGLEGRHAALTRLFDHYLHAAATAMDTLHPSERNRRPRIPAPATPGPPLADPIAARTWLDAERATLVAATVHTAEYGWPGHATRLSATLFRYLESRSHYPEAITIYSHARAAAIRAGDRAAEATALNALSGADRRKGNYQQAVDHLQQALVLFRRINDRTGQARALSNLGMVYRELGQYLQAAEFSSQAVNLFGEIGDRFGEAAARSTLGLLCREQGQYREAISNHERALALARDLGDLNSEAFSLDYLGADYLQQGCYEDARDSLQQALTMFRQVGNRTGEADVLISLGVVCRRQHQLSEAIGRLQDALRLSGQSGWQAGEAEALNRLGEVLLAAGQPYDAHARHAAARAIADQIGNRYEKARACDGLGQACDAVGDRNQARRQWEEALALYADLGVPEADELRARLGAEIDAANATGHPKT